MPKAVYSVKKMTSYNTNDYDDMPIQRPNYQCQAIIHVGRPVWINFL